jgi:hypothetical protein
VDAVTRYEDEHEDLTKYPEVQPGFLHEFWQPRLAVHLSFKAPKYFHPFLNRATHFPHEPYEHI